MRDPIATPVSAPISPRLGGVQVVDEVAEEELVQLSEQQLYLLTRSTAGSGRGCQTVVDSCEVAEVSDGVSPKGSVGAVVVAVAEVENEAVVVVAVAVAAAAVVAETEGWLGWEVETQSGFVPLVVAVAAAVALMSAFGKECILDIAMRVLVLLLLLLLLLLLSLL